MGSAETEGWGEYGGRQKCWDCEEWGRYGASVGVDRSAETVKGGGEYGVSGGRLRGCVVMMVLWYWWYCSNDWCIEMDIGLQYYAY